jgi:hypothetical protein
MNWGSLADVVYYQDDILQLSKINNRSEGIYGEKGDRWKKSLSQT